MLVHYPFSANVSIWIFLLSRNKSDAIFIEASKQVVTKNSKDASKSLAFSLQGVKYWYLKQCAKQKEEYVLRDLLLPLLDPLLVQSIVICRNKEMICRVNTVSNFVVIVVLFSGVLLFYIKVI